MEDIRSIIWEILESPSEDRKTTPPKIEMVEEFGDVDYDDIFTDLYVTVKNLHEFYNLEVDFKATQLLESFLLETLILLKQNPEVTLVTSSPSHVKATAFTPEGESAAFVFDDAVSINSMLEIYNDALAQNNLPQIEAGIGVSSYQSLRDEHGCCCGNDSECECGNDSDCDCDSEDHECDCEEHECSCGHHDSDDFIEDIDNLAEKLALIANTDDFDPIVMNEGFYGLISDLEEEKTFIDSNFQKVIIEADDLTIFHGNIVLEE